MEVPRIPARGIRPLSPGRELKPRVHTNHTTIPLAKLEMILYDSKLLRLDLHDWISSWTPRQNGTLKLKNLKVHFKYVSL